MPVCTVEVVIANHTELGAGKKGGWTTFFLIAFLKTPRVSENVLHLTLSLLFILHDPLKNFLLLKIYEKNIGESSFKIKKNKRNLSIFFVPYHGVLYPWYDVPILTRSYVTISCYTLLHQTTRWEGQNSFRELRNIFVSDCDPQRFSFIKLP